MEVQKESSPVGEISDVALSNGAYPIPWRQNIVKSIGRHSKDVVDSLN